MRDNIKSNHRNVHPYTFFTISLKLVASYYYASKYSTIIIQWS